MIFLWKCYEYIISTKNYGAQIKGKKKSDKLICDNDIAEIKEKKKK